MKLPKPKPSKHKKPDVPKRPDFKAAMKTFATMAQQFANEEVEAQAVRDKDAFVARIKAQAFPSFKRYPLSPRWIATKDAAGRDTRVMIATGTMVNNIKVFRRKGRRIGQVSYRIGFHHRKRARDLDGRIVPMTLNELAAIHEYGSRDHRVPARTHWRVFARELADRAPVERRRIARTVARKIGKALGFK